MKHVVLHIGMHKTGTSALQSALQGYSRRGVSYASFSEVNHSIPIYTIFSGHRYDYHIWKRQGLTRRQIDQRREEYLQVLEEDLVAESSKRLIISGEDISVLREDEKIDLINWLGARCDGIKVVALVRSPISFATSSIQEDVKNGMFKTFPAVDPQYRHRLEVFKEILPKESMVVESYDSLIASGGIESFFNKEMGVRLDMKRQVGVNKSMSLQAMCVISAFNSKQDEMSGTAHKSDARTEIVKHIQSLFSVENGCEQIPREIGESLLSKSALDDVQWLFDNFSIKFLGAQNGTGADFSVHHDLKTPLIHHVDKLHQLFDSYGKKYEPSLDLAPQIFELYSDVLLKRSVQPAVDLMRDVALKIERDPGSIDLNDAMALMKAASNLRPSGPLINQKILEFRKSL